MTYKTTDFQTFLCSPTIQNSDIVSKSQQYSHSKETMHYWFIALIKSNAAFYKFNNIKVEAVK